jgi:hypothetical protein
VGPRAGLDAVEKKKISPARNQTLAVQPVVIMTALSRLPLNLG